MKIGNEGTLIIAKLLELIYVQKQIPCLIRKKSEKVETSLGYNEPKR